MSECIWKKMYLTLCAGILHASSLMPATQETTAAQLRLNLAMQQAEEFYLNAKDEEVEPWEDDLEE